MSRAVVTDAAVEAACAGWAWAWGHPWPKPELLTSEVGRAGIQAIRETMRASLEAALPTLCGDIATLVGESLEEAKRGLVVTEEFELGYFTAMDVVEKMAR